MSKTFSLLLLPVVISSLVACTAKKHARNNEATSSATTQSAKESYLAPVVEQPTGDVKAGELISKQGTKSGAAACIACHGANGEGQAASGFPRLANQSRMYTVAQLKNYQNGSRNNPVMMPIAKALTDVDIENVATYFESIKTPPYPPAAKVNNEILKRGRELADVGDQKMNLQSCANCHGPGGTGQPPSIPYLSGQNSLYIQTQLQSWKNGSRKTNPEHMGYIANSLTEKDIKIVATYFQQIPNSASGTQAPEVETSAKPNDRQKNRK